MSRLARLSRLRRHGGQAAAGVEGAPAVAAEPRDRLAGQIAVIIAIATLVAAVAAFQQADTSELADDLRLEATRLGLQAAASAQRGQAEAQVEYLVYLRSVEQRTSAGNALLRELYADSGSAEARRWQLERERWESLADATAASSAITPDAEHGPERDPSFPARYFARAAQESHRLNALQDAYNEQANLLDQRAAAYTAILAVLAVAVYLLGLTLAVREALLRRGFLTLGVGLMVVAGGWTALTAVQDLAPIREEAAEAYAAARVELDTAFDTPGYLEAEALYDRAIELRPTYARAYVERASATIFAATPQRSGLVSLVPTEALRRGQADLLHAVSLGADTASIHGRLGFYHFLEGMQTGAADDLARSVEASRRAIELDAAEPVYHFNLAVALVALERPDQAREAYAEAVRRVLYIGGDEDRPRNEPWQAEQWLAGALTDLEVVARHRPGLAAEVQGHKGWLVASVAAEELAAAPPAADVEATEVELDVFPGRVQWQARLDGYDPAADTVSVQWYRAAPGTDEVAVIPEISNSDAPFLGVDGRHGLQVAYLGAFSPPECLPAGTYRAEIYVNGVLVAADSVAPDLGGLTASAARDVTIALCRPADWQPIEESLPGVLRGYAHPAGDRGIYLMRMAIPGSFDEVPELTPLVIDTAMNGFGTLFPAPPTYLETEGTTDHDFVGLERTAWRWYDYGTGYVRVAAGLTADGAVMMAMAYGPYDWFLDGEEPYTILNSMVYIE